MRTPYIISRYNHKISWLKDYTNNYFLYDRSEDNEYSDGHRRIKVENLGSDISDKLKFIIDHYDDLPKVGIYIKANLFDYIKPREFEKIKDNQTFTPILSLDHKEVMCQWDSTRPFSYYADGIYWELNSGGYINYHPVKDPTWVQMWPVNPLTKLLGIDQMEYTPFAPGSNYILPKETILKHSKEFYQELRSYLEWAVYPGEAQIIERGLYTIWK